MNNNYFLESGMVDLMVHDVDEGIVRALTKQAGRHGRSAEAEHLAILAAALGRPENPCFADVLSSMPDAGTDADFERIESAKEPPNVFD
jgi:plasmid stability protein